MIKLGSQDLGKTFEVVIEGVLRPARFVGYAINNGESTYSFECTDGSDIFHVATSLEGVRAMVE